MRVSLGQPVIIENVTGAVGSIGVGRVARAAPDGYTLTLLSRTYPFVALTNAMEDWKISRSCS